MSESQKTPTESAQPLADSSSLAPPAPWEEELLLAVLKPLRENSARKAVLEKYGLDHASIEAFLRKPETRRRVAESLNARLVELVPVTVKSLDPEILAKKGWAVKLLLNALSFQKIASQILENADSPEDTIISSAFEKALVQNMLDTLRGKPPEETTEEPTGGEKE